MNRLTSIAVRVPAGVLLLVLTTLAGFLAIGYLGLVVGLFLGIILFGICVEGG
ncbi:hypothetical protein [Salsuginibacillus halophilus]|nr:hypothetical protein [Salsuginibacillus halophilus]